MDFSKPPFMWSFSRAAVFNECRRRYWLHYYGSWGGWAHDGTPFAKTAYVLKNLKNRWMWAGERVHSAIEMVLKDWRKGRTVEFDQLKEQTVGRMRMDFRSSKNKAYVADPKRICGLTEHHYVEEVEDRKWRQCRDDVVTCLSTFFESDWAEQLQQMDQRDWLEVEKLGTFQVDGIPAVVKLDAAHLYNDGVRVIDWKTGKTQGGPDDENEQFQLALYAYYASQHFEVAPDKIWVVAANLYHGDGKERLVTTDALAEIKERVISDAQEMIALMDNRDFESNVVHKADFPLTENTGTCKRCNFREMCHGESWREF